MLCFYADFKLPQIKLVSEFLELVKKNQQLQKMTINMVCLNTYPTRYSDDLHGKYEEIAHFWIISEEARAAVKGFNIEEPNFVILLDMNGKIDYMGNLADSGFKTNYAQVIDKGSSKKPSSYLLNASIQEKYIRKLEKKCELEK